MLFLSQKGLRRAGYITPKKGKYKEMKEITCNNETTPSGTVKCWKNPPRTPHLQPSSNIYKVSIKKRDKPGN